MKAQISRLESAIGKNFVQFLQLLFEFVIWFQGARGKNRNTARRLRIQILFRPLIISWYEYFTSEKFFKEWLKYRTKRTRCVTEEWTVSRRRAAVRRASLQNWHSTAPSTRSTATQLFVDYLSQKTVQCTAVRYYYSDVTRNRSVESVYSFEDQARISVRHLCTRCARVKYETVHHSSRRKKIKFR